jgi:hypothetical protein
MEALGSLLWASSGLQLFQTSFRGNLELELTLKDEATGEAPS